MNKVILMGRLTKDPDVRHNNDSTVARYTLAVDRRGKKDETDFISCVAFGKAGEFAENYLSKGKKIVMTGHIQTGSYINKDGVKIYTTDIVAEDQEFAESRSVAQKQEETQASTMEGFLNIPEGIDEELPFH